MTRRTVVLGVLGLGGATVASAAPTWVSTTGSTALTASVAVTLNGTSAAPTVSAAALVLIAAGLALGLVGPVARWVVLVVIALAGMTIFWSALSIVLAPETAAQSGVAETTGLVGAVGKVTVSPVPYLTMVLGAAIVGVAGWAMGAPIAWVTRASRYDSPGHHAGVSHRVDPPLSAVSTEPGAPGPTPNPVAGDVTAPIDGRDVWDALSDGRDPT